jgi:hypothetical protein
MNCQTAPRDESITIRWLNQHSREILLFGSLYIGFEANTFTKANDMSESSSASSGPSAERPDDRRSISRQASRHAGSSSRPSNVAQSVFANRDSRHESLSTSSSISRPARLHRPSAELPNIHRSSPQSKRSIPAGVTVVPRLLPTNAVKASPGCLGCVS